MTPVSHLLSHASRLMSYVSSILSHVSCHTSPVALYVSSIACCVFFCILYFQGIGRAVGREVRSDAGGQGFNSWMVFIFPSALKIPKLSAINAWISAKIPKFSAINTWRSAKIPKLSAITTWKSAKIIPKLSTINAGKCATKDKNV